MERGQHEMAGLGGGKRRGDRLQVAHLAHEDDVGVLAQRSAQALGEARRVGAELALVDQAALVVVQEFDRILDREDVFVARGVDLVEHGGERRRLARAGGTGDQHDSAGQACHRPHRRRHAEVLQRVGLAGDDAEGGAHRAALHVGVDAHAGDPRDGVGEVDLLGVLELLALGLGEDRVDDLAGLLGPQPREPLERDESTADAQARRSAGGDVDVGGPALNGGEDDIGEVSGHAPSFGNPKCPLEDGGRGWTTVQGALRCRGRGRPRQSTSGPPRPCAGRRRAGSPSPPRGPPRRSGRPRRSPA